MAVVAGLAGCDSARQWLAMLRPESPPPAEVMNLLPMPADAIVDDAGCVGTPGRQGFTCVIHAESGESMERGANDAAHAMTAWKEYSWDWVPGRIQSSWTRGPEDVSIAIHDIGGRSKWSLTYIWGEYPIPISPELFREKPMPGVTMPAQLASLPVPSGATLLAASSVAGAVHADATLSVEGDPASILAPYRSLPGWTKSMDARAPWAISVAARRDAVEVVASVYPGKDGQHILKLRTQPVVPGY